MRCCVQFRASSTCLVHRDEEYTKLLKDPAVCLRCVQLFVKKLLLAQGQIHHFLEGDGKGYFPFQDAMKHQVDRHIRKLYLILGRYNQAPFGVKKVCTRSLAAATAVAVVHCAACACAGVCRGSVQEVHQARLVALRAARRGDCSGAPVQCSLVANHHVLSRQLVSVWARSLKSTRSSTQLATGLSWLLNSARG